MPSVSAPFGLRPAYHPSGTIRPEAYTIATGYNEAVLNNQPVQITSGGVIERAEVGNRFVGTFQGVEWTDTDGRRRVSNQWTASTAGTDIIAYCTRDPQIVYEIQANATLTSKASIGLQMDFTAVDAATVPGISQMMLDVASSAANASLQILNLAPIPGNDWADTYPIVQVRISEHELVADIAAF